MVNNKYRNEAVRRQDRLLDRNLGIELLQHGEYAVLSMTEDSIDGPAGYGIPLNYVWDKADTIYFHSAPEGHKLECLDRYPHASLCVMGKTQVIPHKYTTNYSSIVVRGTMMRHLSEEERMHALELILDKYAPHDKEIGLKYAAKSFHRTEILKMVIESISGKAKQINP